MPKYDYICNACKSVKEFWKTVKDDGYKKSVDCPRCGGKETMEWQYPISSNISVISWTTQHDIGLGCDVSGPRERKQIMDSLGLVEAGDPEGGSRNFKEKGSVGRTAPTGVRHADNQRRTEKGRKEQENTVAFSQTKSGGERAIRHGDQKFDSKKSISYKTT
jgi:putative FmdB family regulatory protein